MKDFEILQSILDEIRGVKQDVQSIKQEVEGIKQEVEDIKQNMATLEKEVKYNTFIVESEINKCIGALNMGYQINAERFDRLDIDSVKVKAEQAFVMSSIVNEKLDKLAEKVNKPAS